MNLRKTPSVSRTQKRKKYVFWEGKCTLKCIIIIYFFPAWGGRGERDALDTKL